MAPVTPLSPDEKAALKKRMERGDGKTIAKALEVTPTCVSYVLAGKRRNEKLWRVAKDWVQLREAFINNVRCAK